MNQRHLLILVILSFLLSGCASTGVNPSETSTAPSIESTAPSVTEPVFSYPIKDCDVTLTMFCGSNSSFTMPFDTREESRVAIAIKEAVGINVDYTDDYINYDNYWNNMVSTGQFTDLVSFHIISYENGVEGAYQDGIAIPLNDVIDAYMPNFKSYLESNPDIARAIRSDDGIYYYVPFINSVSGAYSYVSYYREDMLKALGEEEPKTIQQWHDLLVKVRDHYGITPVVCGINDLLQYGMFAMAYGVGGNSTSKHFALDDSGKVVYQRTSEEWKAFLTEMHKWYEEGLIHPLFDKLSAGDVNQELRNGKAFLVMGWLSAMQQNQISGRQNDEKIQFKAVATPALTEGETPEWTYVTNRVYGTGTTISKSCQNVELAARYLDFFFTEEGHVISNFGIEGESFDVVDGVPTFRPEVVYTPPQGYNQSQSVARYSFSTTGSQGMVKHEAYFPQLFVEPCCVEAIRILQDGVNGGGFLHEFPLTWSAAEDEKKAFANFCDNVSSPVSRTWAIDFICGEKDIVSDWDAYISVLKDSGLDAAYAIISAAMERYNNR